MKKHKKWKKVVVGDKKLMIKIFVDSQKLKINIIQIYISLQYKNVFDNKICLYF